MSKKKILIHIGAQILLLILLATTAYGINTLSEGYRIAKGSIGTKVTVQGVCKTVSCSGGQDIFVPTNSLNEWSSFLNNKPAYVTLGACTSYCDNDGDGYFAQTTGPVCTGISQSIPGNDCNDQCPTCFPGSTTTTASPDALDQDCNGVVDDVKVGTTEFIQIAPDYGSNWPTGSAKSCSETCTNLARSCISVGTNYSAGSNNGKVRYYCSSGAQWWCEKSISCGTSYSTMASYGPMWWTQCGCQASLFK